MSLINDALKRARHEALRQESERGPTVYGAVPAHSRRTSRPWLLVLTGVAVAVAVVSVAWLLVGAWRSSPAKPESPAPVTVREVTTPAVAESAAVDSAMSEPPSSTSSPGAPVNPTIERREGAAVSPETSGAEGEAESGEAFPATMADPPRAPASRQVSGERLREGETYLRRAGAADGSEVRLGGIAYSETHPIAVINGAVVSPGDMIAGFTVISIEPERVELETDGVRIFLALR